MKKCPLCDSTQYEVLYDLSESTVHGSITLPGIIKKCNNCSLMYKDFTKSISEVYGSSYADLFQGLEGYSDSDHSKKFFKDILIKGKSKIEEKENPVLLDVGSAMGTTLDIGKELGFQTKGVEISANLALKAKEKGHEIFNCDISEIDSKEKFDVISMFDIIEHLVDPKEVLINLKNMLKSNGQIIVYTPNHDSLVVKIAHILYKLGFKNGADNIFACPHTIFFTTKTLKRIMTESGFEISEVDQFKYDSSRPGQQLSSTVKFFMDLIESVGSVLGYKGYRVVIYATTPN